MFALLTVAAAIQGNYNNSGGFFLITIIIYFFIDDEARPDKIKIQKGPQTAEQKESERQEKIKDKLAKLKAKQAYWEAKLLRTHGTNIAK